MNNTPLASGAFDWSKLTVVTTPVGERRDFFDAATRTMRNLECHETTLNPGERAHAAHRHPDEELIIVRTGNVEVTINDRVTCAGPGSIFFLASGDLHGLRNAGPTRASYHVLRIVTADTPNT